MKKLLTIFGLMLPLISFADTLLETENYKANIHMSNNYDGPYRDEGVRGLGQENRNGILQQIGMFKSLDVKNEGKTAIGSVFLINSQNKLTSDLVINEALGWLIKDDVSITPCPNFRYLDFVPTCYVRNLKNEVREVSFLVYSAINTTGTDAIVLVGLVGQPVSDGFDYRTIKEPSYTGANIIYYDLLKSIKLTPK